MRCREDVNKIVIYATAPVMRIVGEAEVVEIIEDDLDAVWNLTAELAGISRFFYDQYYHGREKAIAYHLGDVKKYSKPLQLSELGINYAPQSFVYL